MIIHIFEHALISLSNFNYLLIHLVLEPFVWFYYISSVNLCDTFINYRVLKFSSKLIHYAMKLLNVALCLYVSLASYPWGPLHEFSSLLVSWIYYSLYRTQTFFKKFILFNQCSSLSFNFILDKLFISFKCLEIFFTSCSLRFLESCINWSTSKSGVQCLS